MLLNTLLLSCFVVIAVDFESSIKEIKNFLLQNNDVSNYFKQNKNKKITLEATTSLKGKKSLFFSPILLLCFGN